MAGYFLRVFCLGVLLLGPLGAEPRHVSVCPLQLDVEEHERELARVEGELAEARARLAQAESKLGIAISKFRKALELLFGPLGGESKQVSLWQLRNDVERRERELARAECVLTEARARLALAENNHERAVAEIGKAIKYYENHLAWVRANAGLICPPWIAVRSAERELATAKAWLAEVQGKTDDLIRELTKMVVFHEQHVADVKRWYESKAIHERDFAFVEAELNNVRRRLKAAQERLKSQASDPKQPISPRQALGPR